MCFCRLLLLIQRTMVILVTSYDMFNGDMYEFGFLLHHNHKQRLDPDTIWTCNLLIWSQMCYRCANQAGARNTERARGKCSICPLTVKRWWSCWLSGTITLVVSVTNKRLTPTWFRRITFVSQPNKVHLKLVGIFCTNSNMSYQKLCTVGCVLPEGHPHPW